MAGHSTLDSIAFTTWLDIRQPGSVYKKIDTRQSEILTSFHEITPLQQLQMNWSLNFVTTGLRALDDVLQENLVYVVLLVLEFKAL